MLASMYSYTSLEVLGNIDLPKDTAPLSVEKALRLNEFFDDYIKSHLSPAENKLLMEDGYQWLALANPNDLKEGIMIKLLQISTTSTLSNKPVSCTIASDFIPRSKWGLYLFKIV